MIRNIPGEFGAVLRGKIYGKYMKSVGNNFKVLPGTVIVNPQNIKVKDDVVLGYFNFIQGGGGLSIGSKTITGPYAKIWTENHRFESIDKPIIEQGSEFKSVEIGDDVWIGAGAFIMPGAIIADKMVIAAQSVVSAKEYKCGMVLAGHPARVVKERK
jgi:acetyltransferase-like isoleucine patch superfamily enzyme